MSAGAPYISQHFQLEEFLPRAVHARLAQANQLYRGWMLMDERTLRTADQLRDALGLLVINDWHRGGTRDECGLRIPGMATWKETSQHSYGRAADAISRTLSAEDMRRYILAHPDKFPLITRMESGVTWLHWDHGNAERIALVNPS